MFKIVLLILIIIASFVTIIRTLSYEQIQGFWLGIIITVTMEFMFGLLFFSNYLKRQGNKSKLKVNSKDLKIVADEQSQQKQYSDPINDNSIIEDLPQDDIQDLPSDLDSELSDSPIQDRKIKISLGTKLEQYRDRADLYFTKVKNNYFTDQKLPLCKLEKKRMFSRLSALSNIMDLYGQHFTNLSKSYQQIGQIGLLQKLSNEHSQMQPYDETHTHYVNQTLDVSRVEQQKQYIRLPHWNQIKKYLESQAIIQLKQKAFIQQTSQIHILNLQREYQLKHLEMKKLKKLFQGKFAETCRNLQRYVQEQEEIEKNIGDLTIQYKEMKRKKVEPSKLIKHEMKIKLRETELPTYHHKVYDAKYRLKELKNEAIGINLSFNEFKEGWNYQFNSVAKGVVRSFLQNNYELIQQELTTINKLIVFEENRPQTQSYDLEDEMTTSTAIIQEQDIMLSIKSEKENTVLLMNKSKQVDNLFNQIWRYDGEVIGLLMEIREAFRKCQLDDTSKVSTIAQPLMNCGLQWVMKSLVEKEGLIDNYVFYKKCFQSSIMVETSYQECRDTFHNTYKEVEDIIKEKVNQVVFMFNGILKDSEKISQPSCFCFNFKQQMSPSKIRASFKAYKMESEQERSRIHGYLKKCQELLEQHEVSVSQNKFKIIQTLMTLNRDLMKTIRKAIWEFDQNFEDLVKDETENFSDFKSPIPIPPSTSKNKSFIQINGRVFSFDAGTPEFSTDEKKPKTRRDSAFKVEKKVGNIETYLIGRLLKVFFMEWTKSIFFKEKFMEEIYLILNKKRPSCLDEIIVTNVEIKGEPPQLLLVVPQKASNNQFLFDFDVSFRGLFVVEFETKIIVNWPRVNYAQFPLSVKFVMKSLNGRIRVCFFPSLHGKSWFSFIGEPTMTVDLEPVVGKSQYNLSSLPSVSDIIREFLAFKIRRMTYPNKEKLRIPMAASQALIDQSVKDKIKEFVIQWQAKQAETVSSQVFDQGTDSTRSKNKFD